MGLLSTEDYLGARISQPASELQLGLDAPLYSAGEELGGVSQERKSYSRQQGNFLSA
jgi:hypothetical protein